MATENEKEPETIVLDDDENTPKKLKRIFTEDGQCGCCSEKFETATKVKKHLLTDHLIKVNDESPDEIDFVYSDDEEETNQRTRKDTKRKPKRSKMLEFTN